LNVHAIAGWRDLLAKQDRTAIAESSEVAELVAGVRLRDGSPAFGHSIARENRGAFETLERLRLESERRRERPVESGQTRIANRSRCRKRVEELRQLRVGVLKVPASHVTIMAGEHPAVACRECFGRIRSCVQRSRSDDRFEITFQPPSAVSRGNNRHVPS
jgi:hypothetical protein